MRIHFVTLFPEMFAPVMDASIMARARAKGLMSWECVNPRDFSEDKHRKVDDRPFGGGPGMVMMADPIAKAVKSVKKRGTKVVFMSPQGKRLDNDQVATLAREKHLVIVCGHYEGVDERAHSVFDEEVSIGDYVLTGGELPAMVLADAVVRQLPGVLKKDDAIQGESFMGKFLDFPQYTRPRLWRGRKVPEVLFSGDHQKIAEWRRKASLSATRRKRPDLLSRENQTSGERV